MNWKLIELDLRVFHGEDSDTDQNENCKNTLIHARVRGCDRKFPKLFKGGCNEERDVDIIEIWQHNLVVTFVLQFLQSTQNYF